MNYNRYREIQPERSIHNDFGSGEINLKFDLNGQNRWNPSKSYIKFRIKILKGNGEPLDTNYGIAPNMFICDNIFQQIDLRVNGVKVSECNDYIAQCSTLKHRLYSDMNKRDTLLSSVNYSKIDLSDRINQVSSDGFSNLNSGMEVRFIELKQNNGTAILTTEEIRILAGSLNVLDYRNAGGGANGAIDLTETNLKVGDMILMKGFTAAVLGLIPYFRATITNIAAKSITLDRSFPSNIVSEDILTNKIFHIPVNYNSVQSQRSNDITLIWTPHIGFFDINDELCGNYKLELTPHIEGVWQKYALEGLTNREILSKNEVFSHDNIDKVHVSMISMNMYIWESITSSPYSGTKSHTYSDMTCTSQNLTTGSLSNMLFYVNPKNHSVSISYQDSGSGDNITLSRSKFKIVNNQQNNLVRFYIKKDGLLYPNHIPNIQKIENGVIDNSNISGIDSMTQQYYENFIYSNGDDTLLRKEKLSEWYDCGIFFHYKTGIGRSKSNLVSVYSNFSSAFLPINPQILLFDHYSCTINMTVVNGKLTKILKS